jgi:hypothetical protein
MRLWLASALSLAFLFAVAGAALAQVKSIQVLSSRPDRVSGGDALVRIVDVGAKPAPVTLNGADVSAEFQPGPNHVRTGLVSHLRLGGNVLRAGGVTLKLTNYPITGPIFSGPHEAPFVCTTDKFQIYSALGRPPAAAGETFGPALDADCSAKTKITWLYLPKGASELVPLPAGPSLPADVATTTTTAGKTVNFVVRVETATIDRGIYQSTVLFDPTTDVAPTWKTPPRGWNGRLIAVQGAGCTGGWYFQGLTGGSSASMRIGAIDASLWSVARLGEGYALYGNTLQNASQSCNSVLSGEAGAMGKEHFIKEFGLPAYTVSIGCSGGSYGSAQLADALPGLYDGVFIACTFPDPLTIATSGGDAHLLGHVFDVTAKGEFSEAQQLAVAGYKTSKAFLDAANQFARTDPVPGRQDAPGYKSAVFSDVVPASLRYDPKTNPKGARPTIYDVSRNIYGVDPATGFARRTFDNVGVQYGLQALLTAEITAAQFLDLNEKIGGYDADAGYVAARSAGDPAAIRRAYQSGLLLGGGGGLAQIPVFDVSGIYNDDGGYHYQWFHFALRERLVHANGDARNHVMWRGDPVPLEKAWPAFIGWVEAIHADAGPGGARQKTLRDRPAALVDGCFTAPGAFTAEPQTLSRAPSTACNARFPSYDYPRLLAGGPLAEDVLKCRLKPVDLSDYGGHLPADQLPRLRHIFPAGVCDWSKPGVEQTPVIPWASFGPAPENLVFDVRRGG